MEKISGLKYLLKELLIGSSKNIENYEAVQVLFLNKDDYYESTRYNSDNSVEELPQTLNILTSILLTKKKDMPIIDRYYLKQIGISFNFYNFKNNIRVLNTKNTKENIILNTCKVLYRHKTKKSLLKQVNYIIISMEEETSIKLGFKDKDVDWYIHTNLFFEMKEGEEPHQSLKRFEKEYDSKKINLEI